MVCPILGGAAKVARSAGFLASLMGQGLRTVGQVHAHQIKSLDGASAEPASWNARPTWWFKRC